MQQPEFDSIDARDKDKRRGLSGEDKRVSSVEVAGRGLGAGEPSKRGGDPLQRLGGRVVAGKLWVVICSRHCGHLGNLASILIASLFVIAA